MKNIGMKLPRNHPGDVRNVRHEDVGLPGACVGRLRRPDDEPIPVWPGRFHALTADPGEERIVGGVEAVVWAPVHRQSRPTPWQDFGLYPAGGRDFEPHRETDGDVHRLDSERVVARDRGTDTRDPILLQPVPDPATATA